MAETKKVTGMITIKMLNKEFIGIFNPAFTQVSNLPSNPKSGNLKYAIKRSLGGIQKAGERYTSKKREIYEEASLKDDTGNPQLDSKDQYLFPSGEVRKQAIKDVEKLDNEEIELTVYPIRLQTLSDCAKVSIGLEINLMGFIVENLEEDEVIVAEEKAAKKTA